MTNCPFCDHKNIQGAATCDECRHSLSDLRDAPATKVERSLMRDSIGVLKPKTPVAVPPNTATREVLDILVENAIGCVLVVDAGQLLGIFSERDCIKRFGSDFATLLEQPVSNFMTPMPETLDEDTKVAFAVHHMDLGGYRHIPIMAGDRAEGIISVRDILAYLTDRL